MEGQSAAKVLRTNANTDATKSMYARHAAGRAYVNTDSFGPIASSVAVIFAGMAALEAAARIVAARAFASTVAEEATASSVLCWVATKSLHPFASTCVKGVAASSVPGLASASITWIGTRAKSVAGRAYASTIE